MNGLPSGSGGQERCRCGAEAAVSQQAAAAPCSRAGCRVALARAAAQAVVAAQASSDARLRKQLAGLAGIRRPERFPVRRLPVQRQPLVIQRAEHLAPLRAHLESIVSQAVAEAVGGGTRPDEASRRRARTASVQAATLDQACSAACALCGGACCLEGATQMAYLSPETIGRVIAARPKATAGELIDEYLSFASARVTEGGCYFQGRQGCTLPRELRSDTCNRYFCDALRDFRTAVAEPEVGHEPAAVRAFFVVTLPSGRRQVRFHEAQTP